MQAAIELLTPKEAAAHLKVSTRTLSRITDAGKLKAIHLTPQTPRYAPADLQAYINGLRSNAARS